jgi:hypothetical protein
MAVIDEFMTAMAFHFPRACVQFEDFSSNHAAPILEKYRDKTLCFNDDIQVGWLVSVRGWEGGVGWVWEVEVFAVTVVKVSVSDNGAFLVALSLTTAFWRPLPCPHSQFSLTPRDAVHGLFQGTGCVALAGLLSALAAQGKPAAALMDQRILVAGAG